MYIHGQAFSHPLSDVPSLCVYPCVVYRGTLYIRTYVQWNLSIKSTLNKVQLSNEDTVCSLNHIELCPNGAISREVPLYAGQPAGSQWCPL